MNLNDIRSKVMLHIPGLTMARCEPTKDGDGLYFLCLKDKMMRSVFVETTTESMMMFGHKAQIVKADHTIVAEIVQGLKA